LHYRNLTALVNWNSAG